ncbi:MAG: aspartyl protease family protein [Myxococcales bacterium]
MKWRYSRLLLSDGTLDQPRPYLRVRITGPRAEGAAVMLVDSGAGDTILPRTMLEDLGVAFTGEKVRISSFAGEEFDTDIGAVRIRFGGGQFDLTTRVLAFPGPCIPVLGTREFFERYFVAFDAGAGAFMVAEPQRNK